MTAQACQRSPPTLAAASLGARSAPCSLAVRAGALEEATHAYQSAAELGEAVGAAEVVAAAITALKSIGGQRPRRRSMMGDGRS